MNWWWLSFVDPAKPEGHAFLGVAIVPGLDIATACANAHRLGCNPGGEVLGSPLPLTVSVPQEYCERLLTRKEAKALNTLWGGQEV